MQRSLVILFDLDGTLIDSTPAILESFEVAFRSFNKPIPPQKEIKKLTLHGGDIKKINSLIDRLAKIKAKASKIHVKCMH